MRMSRAYRIQVSETLRRVIRGSDNVSTHLEILNVLPPDDMSDLLTQELLRRGFEQKGAVLVREQDGIEVLIDPSAGQVTVQIAGEHEIAVSGEATGWSYEQKDKKAQQTLSQNLQAKLERQAEAKEQELQTELTNKLEAQLGDLRKELDQIANQVTAAALKKKAAQLGQIKQISEDPQTGSMTIVLEV
jgi:hypothetical protein